MIEENKRGLRRIKRALLSVSDKTGIVEFARELQAFNVELISTGGTASALRATGLEVRDVSEITGFSEMMDGRIKTLHPRIHGALLALRDNPEHRAAMETHGMQAIDMVVINLYPFEETVARAAVTLAEAIEQIDIGGPAMIRSAAKNFQDVAVVVSPSSYPELTAEMKDSDGSLSLSTRSRLAISAFERTSSYDAIVFDYLNSHAGRETSKESDSTKTAQAELSDNFQDPLCFSLAKQADLRYGENPHQQAALYTTAEQSGIAAAQLLSGKEMSFNNYVDADAAWQLVCDFSETACAIIKHTNPAGAAFGATANEAYRKALATDPVSAFGGIVAFNCAVDETAARSVIEIFTEVVIASEYDEAALDILRTKKNLRVLRGARGPADQGLEYKQISGGMLAQTRDHHRLSHSDLKVVSKRQPTEAEIAALLFAWTVCKHTKSNAIVYARAGQTVGVGAGQMSRIDSVKLGAMRAQLPVAGSVIASDAFFPFRDGIDEAANHGITAVIEPGGSVKDAEVIAAADEHGLALVFTGIRHFKH